MPLRNSNLALLEHELYHNWKLWLCSDYLNVEYKNMGQEVECSIMRHEFCLTNDRINIDFLKLRIILGIFKCRIRYLRRWRYNALRHCKDRETLMSQDPPSSKKLLNDKENVGWGSLQIDWLDLELYHNNSICIGALSIMHPNHETNECLSSQVQHMMRKKRKQRNYLLSSVEGFLLYLCSGSSID
jgi:hypothetical protein